MNQTQVVRTSINIFIMVSVGISLFQELGSLSSSPSPSQQIPVNPETGQPLPTEPVGPKVEGLAFECTDKEQHQLKQILIRNEVNVDIQPYQFEGNEYYINLVMNWGHIVLIYVLMGKYKSEENPDIKKKIMIGGALAVILWFGATTTFRLQRVRLQHNGITVYQRDALVESEISDALATYEFEFDDLKEQADLQNGNTFHHSEPMGETITQGRSSEEAETGQNYGHKQEEDPFGSSEHHPNQHHSSQGYEYEEEIF